MIEQINEVKNQGVKEKELKDMKEGYLTEHFMGLETNDSQTMSLGLQKLAEIGGKQKRSCLTLKKQPSKILIMFLRSTHPLFTGCI